MQAADVTYSSGTTLTSDLRLSLSQRAIFNATLTLNGSGFLYDFPSTPDPVLIVNNSFTATLQNLLLRNFSTSHLSLGSGSSIIFGDKTVLQLLFDQTLTQTLNFSGSSNIIGNQNTVDLGTGKIVINAGGSLRFCNIKLKNITNLNLVCADNTASMIFENTTISIPNKWNFSTGSFSVLKNVKITDGIFCYASGMSSTIKQNSSLIFTNNLTFSYDPAKLSGQAVASKTNLTFSDTSSWLFLDNSSLFITSTGMHLCKGSLGIIGKNILYSDATLSASEGLCFGDGTSITNDLNVTNFNSPSASLDIKRGSATYQNVEVQQITYLKYGDLFSLKNNAFGFYLGYTAPVDYSGGWLEYVGRSLSSPDNTVQFYAQQDDTPSRWGSQGGTPGLYTGSKIGQPVKSGDSFRFERFYSASQPFQTNPNSRMPFFIYDQPAPTTSGANYKRANIGLNNSAYSYIMRIYKQGGNVGDPITENDLVYIVGYKQPNPGTQFPASAPASFNTQCILSTLNANATVGGNYYQILSESGLKEVFPYESTGPVTGFPSNIKTNALFQVKGVVSGAYATAASHTAYDNYVTNSVFYDIIGGHNGQGYTVAYAVQIYLPAASLNQF